MFAHVDGTLVTREKPHAAGVLFAITSGRPARGMAMPVEPLGVTSPIAAFNGGLFVNSDLSTVERRVVPPRVVAPAIALLESFALDVWLYRAARRITTGRQPSAPGTATPDRRSGTAGFAGCRAALPGNPVRIAAEWVLDAVLPRQIVGPPAVPLNTAAPERGARAG
jgi:hypothetical protein